MAKDSDPLKSELEKLCLQFNTCVVLVSLTLTFFMSISSPATSLLKKFKLFEDLPNREIADGFLVLLLNALVVIGFIFLPMVTAFLKGSKTRFVLSASSLIALILPLSMRSPESEMWSGWGDRFALFTILGGVLTAYFILKFQYNYQTFEATTIIKCVNVGSISLLTLFYLPSIIQPFSGIIDLAHSRFILNEILIFASDKLPYADISPQYTGFLGFPLRIIPFLSGETLVNSALVWVNVLVLIEIYLISLLTKNALNISSWAIAVLLPVALVFGKAQPNTDFEGSIAQHMTIIPVRTLMPILLLVLITEFALTKKPRAKMVLILLIGAISVLTSFNNLDFGVPATISGIVTLILFIGHPQQKIRNSLLFILGLLTSFILIFSIYLLSNSQLSFSNFTFFLRLKMADSAWASPMPMFGLWILFFSILGTSAIIGSIKLLQVSRTQEPSTQMFRSLLLLTFCGIWGTITLSYFAGRSMPQTLAASLIPFSLCIIGFCGIAKSLVISSNVEPKNRTNTSVIALVPLCALIAMPLVSFYLAPNPNVEWSRVARGGQRWSSRSIESTSAYAELVEIVRSDFDNQYAYIGDNCVAIEILSDIECGLGILDLAAFDEVVFNTRACEPMVRSGADYALIEKAVWTNTFADPPCAGFKLLPIDSASEFLIYEIPSKVSS